MLSLRVLLACGSSLSAVAAAPSELQCPTACAAPSFGLAPRVRFITHGTSDDDFWARMKATAVTTSERLGVDFDSRRDWLWADGDAQAANVRAHAGDVNTTLIVSVPSPSVAEAVAEAVAAGTRVIGINSGLDLVQERELSLAAFVSANDVLAGQLAAERMLSVGVRQPIFVDHGTPVGGGDTQKFALDRWRGFSGAFEAALNVTPSRVAIGAMPLGWETPASEACTGEFRVLSRMQQALHNSSLLSCAHDGVLASGVTALEQTVHALEVGRCFDAPGARPASLGTFDDEPVARALLATGLLDFIVGSPNPAVPQNFLEAFVALALVALSPLPGAAVLPRGHEAVNTGSLLITEAAAPASTSASTSPSEREDDAEALLAPTQMAAAAAAAAASCGAMCTVEAALSVSGTVTQRCLESGASAVGTSSLAAENVRLEAQGVGVVVCANWSAAAAVLVGGGTQQQQIQTEQGTCGLRLAAHRDGPCSLPVLGGEESSGGGRIMSPGAVRSLVATLSSLLASLVLCFACNVLRRRYVKQLRLMRLGEAEMVKRVLQALETTRSIRHPTVLMPAEHFEELGRLVTFEEARDRGLLRFHDTLGDTLDSTNVVVFFSHQWTSKEEPDPTGRQYEVMRSSLREISARNDWPLSRVMVWVDYHSIPQVQRVQQENAILSLSAYASMAHAFVIVSPPVQHADLGIALGIDTYRSRMWCRAEMLCHTLRNGTESMWLAVSEGAPPVRLGEDAAWVREVLPSSIRVFDGEASVEEDKLCLVPIVLGLYAEMLVLATNSSDVQPVVQMISEAPETFFPPTFTPESSARTARKAKKANKEPTSPRIKAEGRRSVGDLALSSFRSASFRSFLRPEADRPVPVELFGGLVARLERMLEEEPELKEQLRQQVVKRAYSVVRLQQSLSPRRESSRGKSSRRTQGAKDAAFTSSRGTEAVPVTIAEVPAAELERVQLDMVPSSTVEEAAV
jgi:hypothetical protein